MSILSNITDYVKRNWKNGMLGNTPVSARNLNAMDETIFENREFIKALNANNPIRSIDFDENGYVLIGRSDESAVEYKDTGLVPRENIDKSIWNNGVDDTKALQARSGNTIRRLQIQSVDDRPVFWTSSDGGDSWSGKSIAFLEDINGSSTTDYDANNHKTTGFFHTGSDWTNIPNNVSGGLFVFSAGSNAVLQIWFQYQGYGKTLVKLRYFMNYWTSWYDVVNE